MQYYACSCSITDKLKNLFLLFAGHIVKSVATLLNSNHIDKEGMTTLGTTLHVISMVASNGDKHYFYCPFASGFPFFDSNDESVSVDKSCLLLHYIIQTLTKCFLYEKSGFLTKERFDTLLQPLVDQVYYDNVIL